MYDPQNSQDNVTRNQSSDQGPKGTHEALADYDAQQEETNRDLGKRQRGEGLYPFSVRILIELPEVVVIEVPFVPTEAVVDLNQDECKAEVLADLLECPESAHATEE